MPGHSPHAPRYRLALFQLALTGWALVVVGRLYWLQVVDHAWLTARARIQQQETVPLPAQRGVIYDRSLTPLAMSLPVVSVFATPRRIANAAGTATALAGALGLDARAESELARHLQARRSFLWVARQVTAEKADAIEALHLPGVYTQPATRRFYPKGRLAANVLGFVGLDGHGLAGLEESYDPVMAGRPGEAVLEVDAHRRGYSQVERPPQQGEDLVLTLDQNIQYIAQQELDREVEATHAVRGVAVVENPRTGEILALANSPSFNPNHYQDTPPALLGDPAASLPYEPGSVFKLVTLSAALQQGLITPNELVNCQMGSIVVGGRLIHDHAEFGIITVADILKYSSDVGAIKVGLKLGDDEFYHYIRAYGFGRPTGIGLPGESAGLLRPPQDWRPNTIGSVSMGQSVAITPLQEIAMISSIANGGVYHSPRLVIGAYPAATLSAAAGPPAFRPGPGRRIVSARVANEMKQMMAGVMMPGGTGQLAQLDGYTSGGKSGTAQMVDPGKHRYSLRNYVASFGGFAPLNDPAVAILVVVVAPRNGHEGGAVAGPVFKRIAERVLPYLGVPHDVPVATPPAMQARATPAPPAPPAALPPTEQAAETVPPGMVVLDYGRRGIHTPDFTGQTVRAVSAACQRLGLDLTLQGSGIARTQYPAAGTPLARGDRVVVSFSP